VQGEEAAVHDSSSRLGWLIDTGMLLIIIFPMGSSYFYCEAPAFWRVINS
jgi:hypothetical protein